jgi:hypothetical protein
MARKSSASGLDINDIAKAVSGAVSSVLSKMDNENRLRGQSSRASSDSDDNEEPVKKKIKANLVKTKPSLPSSFLGKRNKGSHVGSKAKEKLFTYDRDIICLPMSHGDGTSAIKIPKSRMELAKNGLIGKIRLTSMMTEEVIFDEIRSVFRGPMNGNTEFSFEVLQPMGGTSKCLTIPSLSDSFKWTASAIVPKNAKNPLYILAKEPLVQIYSDDDSDSFVDLTKDLKNSSHTPTVTALSIEPSVENESYENLLDFNDMPYSPTPPSMSPLTPPPMITSSVLSVSEVLSSHKSKVLPLWRSDYSRITVRRSHVLTDTLHFLRNGLDCSQNLRVVFVGEPAVDDGGPLREFLYLLMKALASNNMILCGPDESRMPMHNVTELKKNTFYYVGVIIALSLILGGPAPQFFTPAVADYIIYGSTSVIAGVADVVNNSEIREKIRKIENAGSVSELQNLLESDSYDFRYDLGINVSPLDVSLLDRENIVSSMAFHYGVLTVKAELDQMLCGLSETLNALELIRNNAAIMKPLFLWEHRTPPTADYVYDLMTPKLSEPGSNRRDEEEAIMMLWVEFLRIVQGINKPYT